MAGQLQGAYGPGSENWRDAAQEDDAARALFAQFGPCTAWKPYFSIPPKQNTKSTDTYISISIYIYTF